MPDFRELAKDVHAFLQPPLICHSSAGVIIEDRIKLRGQIFLLLFPPGFE
jgi:hypothetical protein